MSSKKTCPDCKSRAMRGRYVSRSVYQKLAVVNKKLLEDLRIITIGKKEDSYKVWIHWRKHFFEREMFWSELAELLRKEAKKPNNKTLKN